MGRGLSDLQKTILRLAYENRIDGLGADGMGNGIDIHYPEVLAAYWQLPLIRPARCTDGLANPGSYWHGHHFDRDAIGPDRYDAAMAALSRAMARLSGRGLVVRRAGAYFRRTGCSLTPNGMALALKLSVSIPPSCRDVNRYIIDGTSRVEEDGVTAGQQAPTETRC